MFWSCCHDVSHWDTQCFGRTLSESHALYTKSASTCRWVAQNICWSNSDVIQVTLVTASVIIVFVPRIIPQYGFLSSHVFLWNQREEQSCVCMMGREDLLPFLLSLQSHSFSLQIWPKPAHIYFWTYLQLSDSGSNATGIAYKKTGVFDLTNLVSTGNSLHGRTGTASPDSTGPS